MKRTLSALAVAAAALAAVPAHAVQPSFNDNYVAPAGSTAIAAPATVRAQALPQPSFVDFTVITAAEQARTSATTSTADLMAGLPQPSSVAN